MFFFWTVPLVVSAQRPMPARTVHANIVGASGSDWKTARANKNGPFEKLVHNFSK
jgi:hypothetical protein